VFVWNADEMRVGSPNRQQVPVVIVSVSIRPRLLCSSEGQLQSIERKMCEQKLKLQSKSTRRRKTKLKDHRRRNEVKKPKPNEKIRKMMRRFAEKVAKAKKRGAIE
jgi:hypothetical protein